MMKYKLTGKTKIKGKLRNSRANASSYAFSFIPKNSLYVSQTVGHSSVNSHIDGEDGSYSS